MTVTQTITRDQLATSTLKRVIAETLSSPAPKEISVTATDNHSGEPSFYVYVEMLSEQDIPREREQNRLAGKMISALEQIDDVRFPYLYFGPRAQPLESADDEEDDATSDEGA